ncbi:MAG: hypothetical protein HYX48_07290 [Chlamydiales bacterium]|nr:hypothetical protein [Chlamydiales bacterium]
MKKTPSDKLEIEKALLPRLRMMGFILIFLCLFTLTYALLSEPYLPAVVEQNIERTVEEAGIGLPDLEEQPDFLVTKGQRLNLFLVSSVFGLIGIACFFYFWKKKERMQVTSDAPPAEGEG